MTISLNYKTFSWQHIDDYTNLLNRLALDNKNNYKYNLSDIKEKLSYPSFNPQKNLFLISNNNNEPIGYISFNEEKFINRVILDIKILKLHKNDENQTKIIRKALELASSLHTEKLNIQTSEYDKSIQNSLTYFNFKKIKIYFNMQLKKMPVINLEPPNDFFFSTFLQDNDEEKLTKLQNSVFKDSWGFCPNTTEEIKYRIKMHNTKPEGIIILKNRQEYVGYNWTTYKNKSGKISMTGILPQFRSKGLGNILVGKGIEYLFNNNHSTVELEVDSNNIKALQIYKKLGFNKSSEIWWYEKEISN